jgi:hypothetical protein
MKRIKNYEDFKNDRVNEEFLGSLLAAAKGAFKNFLTGISAPFKSLKDDFKKGLKREELKKKISTMLDTLLKTTTDSINKAEDESALSQISLQFTKEFDEKCVEIDKEIQAVKESKGNLILEGAIKDGMIAGRVMLGMIKQKAAAIKMDFDKKLAAAKDLAGKKVVEVQRIKAIVDDFKKKVTDDKYIDEQIAKYEEENKITDDAGGDYKVGDKVIYKDANWEKNKGEEAWDKLSDDDKKDEGKLKELIDDLTVGVKEIKKVEKDFVRFTDVDWIKNFDEILGKVEGGGSTGNIVLDWGDVEIEVKPADKKPGYYQVVKSGSKKLIVKEGETVLAKLPAEAKKGEKVKLTEILRNDKPDAMKEYETGNLERIVDATGKEVDTIKFVGAKAEGQEDLVKTLADVKAKNPDAIKKLGDIAKIYQEPDKNKDKIAEIEKQLGGGE